MNSKLNLLFPVETINRELDFRLFMACLSVNGKNRVFVGQHDALDRLRQTMRGGVYLGKHIFKQIFPNVDVSPYVDLKKSGFKLIHLDEEGAVYPGDEEQWKKSLRVQFNPNYLCADDYVCTWGKFQMDFYKSRQPACAENIYPTGHPRFDLYKPAYQNYFSEAANALREKFGDFVLINTNLSFANNGLGMADMFSARNNYYPEDYETRTRHIDSWAHTMRVLSRMAQLINRLSKEFPETTFIIRPHPAEDWTFYENIFNGFGNIKIIHEGSVAPWLLACRLLIHDGCTTGIEAFLAGKTVICYKSFPDPQHDIFLPDAVGIKCTTENEAVAAVRNDFSGGNEKVRVEDIDPLVGDLMANFKQNSFQAMLEVIKKAEASARKGIVSAAWDENRFTANERIYRLKSKAKQIVRPLFKDKYQQYLFFKNNHFFGFDEEMIGDRLGRIKKTLKVDIKYKFVNEDLVLIESAG